MQIAGGRAARLLRSKRQSEAQSAPPEPAMAAAHREVRAETAAHTSAAHAAGHEAHLAGTAHRARVELAHAGVTRVDPRLTSRRRGLIDDAVRTTVALAEMVAL